MSPADEGVRNYISTLEHRFAGVAEDEIPAIAISLHERLMKDPSWAGFVPSVEQIEADYRRVMAGAPDGRPPWLARLAERLAVGTEIALRGSAVGRPHFLLLAWTDGRNTGVHPVEGSESEYLVVIHESMPSYVELVVRSVVDVLPDDFGARPFNDDELRQAVKERVRSDPERGPVQFAEASVYMAAEGHVRRVERRTPVRSALPGITQLHDSALTFMMAHEVGHFELGHLGPRTPALDVLGAAHATNNFDRELQADEVGLSQSSHAMSVLDGSPLALASLGAWFFLSAYEALEHAVCVLMAGSVEEGRRRFEVMQNRRDSGRHPSPSYRKLILYRTLQRATGGSEVLTDLWRGADIALASLVSYARYYAESGIGYGLKPSPVHWGHEKDLAYRSRS